MNRPRRFFREFTFQNSIFHKGFRGSLFFAEFIFIKIFMKVCFLQNSIFLKDFHGSLFFTEFPFSETG